MRKREGYKKKKAIVLRVPMSAVHKSHRGQRVSCGVPVTRNLSKREKQPCGNPHQFARADPRKNVPYTESRRWAKSIFAYLRGSDLGSAHSQVFLPSPSRVTASPFSPTRKRNTMIRLKTEF